jgi:riboflavin synthase
VFTGIVEELGQVAELVDLGDSVRLGLRGPTVTTDAHAGDSIAVNGVCLTVVTTSDGVFTADVMRETLERSSLGALAVGSPVNLERPTVLGGRLGGHLVQGHVDGVGRLLARTSSQHWDLLAISLPVALARYVVEKGSITVDGVSLTVVSVSDERFSVSLIPTTLALTTLGTKVPGDPVNLEVDVIAKYVERLMALDHIPSLPDPTGQLAGGTDTPEVTT